MFFNFWEQRKVSEITEFHKQGFYTTEEYDISKKYYLLRGTDLIDNVLKINDTPKIDATEKDYVAFKVEVGDFLIVRSGNVGTYGIVYDEIPAIFGSYLIDFRFNKKILNNEFFGCFYQSDSCKSQFKGIIQQSANVNINAENIKSLKINLPTLLEQEKIGQFFKQLDNLISLHQREHKFYIFNLVQIKISLLNLYLYFLALV
ncbi:restriction endonuclease subunit S [Clostridium sp. MSJ-8]|uniref:restriction endonuclease subunit S n=1 Tax=Clostridium sp. MSJ-8 TaxID=2841510 RepID=UPI001C0E9112|nr:restriction endonuclease subunit S [Clostridium sp. MSJ-8]